MTQRQTISVIVPSYKRPVDLRRCLRAIAGQTRPADEVLVTMREEDTETAALVPHLSPSLKNLRCAYVQEPGLIAALNCALGHARGDFLVFTDDDAEAGTDWLAQIEQRFENPKVGAVGGRDWLQLPLEPSRYQPTEASRVGVITWFGKSYGNHHRPVRGHVKEVMFLKGVNMAFRRTALGPARIDTRLCGTGSQVGTELDLCSQVRRFGYTLLFDDRILVKHHCAARPKEDDRCDTTGAVFNDICFNTHFLVAKHFGSARSIAYLINNLLFGWRSQPGLLAATKWRFKGDRKILRRLPPTARAALSGFKAGRKAKVLERRRSNQGPLEVAEQDGPLA